MLLGYSALHFARTQEMQIHSDHFCQLGWIRCAFSGIAVAAKFGFRISCERPMISFIASFHATTAGKQATLCRSIPTVGAVRSVSVHQSILFIPPQADNVQACVFSFQANIDKNSENKYSSKKTEPTPRNTVYSDGTGNGPWV